MIQEYYHKIENDFDIDDDELSYFDVFEKKQNKYIKSGKDIEDEKYWISMFNDFERPSSVKRRDYNVGIDAKLIAS